VTIGVLIGSASTISDFTDAGATPSVRSSEAGSFVAAAQSIWSYTNGDSVAPRKTGGQHRQTRPVLDLAAHADHALGRHAQRHARRKFLLDHFHAVAVVRGGEKRPSGRPGRPACATTH